MLLFTCGPCYVNGGAVMEILFKLFLLAYLSSMVLATILGVICILTAIFTPEWSTKNSPNNHGYKLKG
jgi:hypothetical protein